MGRDALQTQERERKPRTLPRKTRQFTRTAGGEKTERGSMTRFIVLPPTNGRKKSQNGYLARTNEKIIARKKLKYSGKRRDKPRSFTVNDRGRRARFP